MASVVTSTVIFLVYVFTICKLLVNRCPLCKTTDNRTALVHPWRNGADRAFPVKQWHME
jgi:hypothetical protein